MTTMIRLPIPPPSDVPVPEPREDETDEEFRRRLRVWFDATPGGSPGEWLYICALMGVDPD
jgi:hypothetical protein